MNYFCPHELLQVHLDRFVGRSVLLGLFSPVFEVLDQLVLHIAHMDSRATDRESREGNFCDQLGCVFKDRNDLYNFVKVL